MDELTMGARIARSRKEKGLTQEALANALGVSNQAVSKWEGDVCCPGRRIEFLSLLLYPFKSLQPLIFQGFRRFFHFRCHAGNLRIFP